MEIKTAEVSIKAAGEGRAQVVIATLNTKDRDGDVLLPGAFGEQVVPVVGAHQWSTVPIGKARVFEVGNEAIADIKFYLTTDAGKNWYAAIKEDFDNPPAKQQYSWGFSTSAAHVKHGQHHGEQVRFLKATDDGDPIPIHEVSPVLVAAGMNTRSVHVKEQADPDTSEITITPPPLIVLAEQPSAAGEGRTPTRLIHPHHTAVDEHTWDGVSVYRQIKDTMLPAYYRNLYAWQDPQGPERAKGSYRFLHHFVSKRGDAGAASVRACAQILEWLHSGQATAPVEELQAIYAHVAAHLKDAGREVPELRIDEPLRYPLDDQLELLLWKQDSVLQQIDQVRDMRARKGMTLSAARLQQLDTMKQRFDALCSLVALKSLDRPADAVLEQLSAEARAEAFGRRIEQMQSRAKAEVEEANAAAAQAAFERFQALQEKIRAS